MGGGREGGREGQHNRRGTGPVSNQLAATSASLHRCIVMSAEYVCCAHNDLAPVQDWTALPGERRTGQPRPACSILNLPPSSNPPQPTGGDEGDGRQPSCFPRCQSGLSLNGRPVSEVVLRGNRGTWRVCPRVAEPDQEHGYAMSRLQLECCHRRAALEGWASADAINRPSPKPGESAGGHVDVRARTLVHYRLIDMRPSGMNPGWTS